MRSKEAGKTHIFLYTFFAVYATPPSHHQPLRVLRLQIGDDRGGAFLDMARRRPPYARGIRPPHRLHDSVVPGVIGSAPGRERGCQTVYTAVGAVGLKNNSASLITTIRHTNNT